MLLTESLTIAKARIARLELELADSAYRHPSGQRITRADVIEWDRERQRLMVVIKTLRDNEVRLSRLWGYARHLGGCAGMRLAKDGMGHTFWQPGDEVSCTCGLGGAVTAP